MARRTGKGAVFLIGAGPGDPDLLTLRGRDRVGEADLILFDPGLAPGTLRHARRGTQRVPLPSAAPDGGLTPVAIRRWLIAPARKGKRVAVVRPGDPFLTGGGREAEAVSGAGIEYEVVPGIPEGLGAAACAGIPAGGPGAGILLAPRGLRRSGLPRGSGRMDPAVTLVAGVRTPQELKRLLDRLRAGGLSSSASAALIARGSRPAQRVVTGTLAGIAAAARRVRPAFPLQLIVGPGVKLRPRLEWLERRRLHGLRIVVTRAAEQAEELAAILRRHGAEVLEMPMIEFGPPPSWRGFDRAAARMDRFDWVVFTSATGVRYALERLHALGKDARCLAGVGVAAIGPKTAEVLAGGGLRPDRIPDAFLTEGLLRMFPARRVRGRRFLLARGDLADRKLAVELRRRGGRVENVVVYRTLRPAGSRRREWERRLAAGVDLVLFTSPSTVNHFVGTFGRNRALGFLRRTEVGCIGPVTARAVRGFGVRRPIVSRVHTIPGLVEAVLRRCSTRTTPRRPARRFLDTGSAVC